MNIGCFREAAEHFLTALSGHGGVHVSKTLWDTLYRNFVLMERPDLAEMARGGTLDVFRKEFEF